MLPPERTGKTQLPTRWTSRRPPSPPASPPALHSWKPAPTGCRFSGNAEAKKTPPPPPAPTTPPLLPLRESTAAPRSQPFPRADPVASLRRRIGHSRSARAGHGSGRAPGPGTSPWSTTIELWDENSPETSNVQALPGAAGFHEIPPAFPLFPRNIDRSRTTQEWRSGSRTWLLVTEILPRIGLGLTAETPLRAPTGRLPPGRASSRDDATSTSRQQRPARGGPRPAQPSSKGCGWRPNDHAPTGCLGWPRPRQNKNRRAAWLLRANS